MQLTVSVLFLVAVREDQPGAPIPPVVLLTILASAFGILVGVALRCFLCCAMGGKDDKDPDAADPGELDDGVELEAANPTFRALRP